MFYEDIQRIKNNFYRSVIATLHYDIKIVEGTNYNYIQCTNCYAKWEIVDVWTTYSMYFPLLWAGDYSCIDDYLDWQYGDYNYYDW